MMFKIKKYIPDIVVAIILIAGIGLLAIPRSVIISMRCILQKR